MSGTRWASIVAHTFKVGAAFGSVLGVIGVVMATGGKLVSVFAKTPVEKELLGGISSGGGSSVSVTLGSSMRSRFFFCFCNRTVHYKL